jgi:hypothetical protein
MGPADQPRTLSRSRQCNSWMHAAPAGLSWKRCRSPEKFEVRLDEGEFTEGHELDRKNREANTEGDDRAQVIAAGSEEIVGEIRVANRQQAAEVHRDAAPQAALRCTYWSSSLSSPVKPSLPG